MSENLIEELKLQKVYELCIAEQNKFQLDLTKKIIDHMFVHLSGSCKFCEVSMPVYDEDPNTCLYHGRTEARVCTVSLCPLLKGD